MVAPRIDFVIVIVFPGGENELELDPLHVFGSVVAHHRIPLNEGAKPDIAKSRMVFLQEIGSAGVKVHFDLGDNEVQTPFPAAENLFVGLINELGDPDPRIQAQIILKADRVAPSLPEDRDFEIAATGVG